MENLIHSKQKTRKLVVILSIIAVILTFIGIAVNKYVAVVGLVIELLAIFILFHYLTYKGDEKHTNIAYHFVALACIFAICCLVVANYKTLSSTILGTACFVSIVAGFAYAFTNNLIISIIYGLLMIIPVALKQATIFNIALIVLSLIACVITFVKKNKKDFVVAEVVTIILAIYNLVSKTTYIYHELLTICTCFMICGIISGLNLADVVTKEKEETKQELSEEEKMMKWVDKAYRNKSFVELLDCPVDALLGVSETDAELLKSAFGIKTIGDFATNKYFAWAKEIVEEANQK